MKPFLKLVALIALNLLLVITAFWVAVNGLKAMSYSAHMLAYVLLWAVPVGAGFALLVFLGIALWEALLSPKVVLRERGQA